MCPIALHRHPARVPAAPPPASCQLGPTPLSTAEACIAWAEMLCSRTPLLVRWSGGLRLRVFQQLSLRPQDTAKWITAPATEPSISKMKDYCRLDNDFFYSLFALEEWIYRRGDAQDIHPFRTFRRTSEHRTLNTTTTPSFPTTLQTPNCAPHSPPSHHTHIQIVAAQPLARLCRCRRPRHGRPLVSDAFHHPCAAPQASAHHQHQKLVMALCTSADLQTVNSSQRSPARSLRPARSS
ncbi:hypothetical protein BDV95DRAFT_138000 [Massariosphaeria phaeospora]|uniref:Uncharacterized protein n=1 Tax=Massariosphaeria phaeospora TaxID=100035 RepID=A0A7C8MCM1_9PLEO|nr:hypothetical protein BDV95DRAFT_138000 [Massariosphaeria phaeospora]